MNIEVKVRDTLSKEFEARRADRALDHFLACVHEFEQTNWESSLTKAGKFIEAVVKMLWVYCRRPLPRPKDFKAGFYAQKIINEIDKKTMPQDELRLQIPRASIFIYDITSNRGGRHDPEELDPNEMDASAAVSMCSWILAELVRFSAKRILSTDEAKEMVHSLTERHYPTFEKIGERIYVEPQKYKGAIECSILILYRLYPKRTNKKTLLDFVKRHSFKETAFKFERLKPYVDIDTDGNILLRATGRKKAEQILRKRN